MSYDNLFWGSSAVPNHTQWRIKAEKLHSDCDIFHATSTKKFPLGALAESRDGRKWRYCENGAVALTKALVNQSAAGTANWQDELQTNGNAAAIGDKIFTVTCASTASAHEFIDGYLTVEQGTGGDELYIIRDNDAGVANATSGYDIKCYIADAGGIRVATATTSNITLTKNKWKDVIVLPTDPTGARVGVNLVAVPANYFFWAQTRGPCPVTKDSTDTIVVGDMVSAGHNVAGQCCLMDVAAEGDTLLGYCIRASANAETAIIDLCLE